MFTYGPSQVPLCWPKFILNRKYLVHFVFSFCVSWYLDELGDCAAHLISTHFRVGNTCWPCGEDDVAMPKTLSDFNGVSIIFVYNKIEKWSFQMHEKWENHFYLRLFCSRSYLRLVIQHFRTSVFSSINWDSNSLKWALLLWELLD